MLVSGRMIAAWSGSARLKRSASVAACVMASGSRGDAGTSVRIALPLRQARLLALRTSRRASSLACRTPAPALAVLLVGLRQPLAGLVQAVLIAALAGSF